jgi:hypothetical protein
MTRGMTMLAVVVVAILVACAPAASALDLTGTWEGKQTCKGLAEGEKVTFTCCEKVEITQSGDTVNIKVNGGADGADFYFGRVTTLTDHPDKGAVTFVSCPTNNTVPNLSEMVFSNVTDDPKVGSVKGTLKGEGPFLETSDEQYVCTWSYKRVNRTDPLIPPCSFGP